MGLLTHISARQRITIGLVGLTAGTLLIASAVGFFPNQQKQILNGRAKLSESLAISSMTMANSGQLKLLQATFDSIVNRDPDILSVGLRTDEDGLLVTAGLHEENWIAEGDIQQMRVPVYRKGEHCGHLEICFRSTGGLLGLNDWAPAWLLIVIPACFLQFNFYLRKTLKHLNPSDRVPQHVQDALDTLSVGLVLMDEGGRILFGNAELANSIGRTQDDLLNVNAFDLNWQTSEDDDHGLPWEQVARSGRSVEDRIVHMDVNGRRRTFSVNCSSVGKGIMATLDDITLLEEAREAAQQADESKNAFLANMSHEIRTPLNAVLGFTDVLRRGLVTDAEESIDHLNMIHRSGKHLLELINDILDLSKIEAGKMDVESIDTQVNEIIHETVDVLGVRANERGLDLKVDFRTAIPRVIQSDPTRLRQIITNLVGNAIKFTQQGGVTVAVQMAESDPPQLQIDIIDTGIGMTPEQQTKVFDSFSQADSTTTRKFGGTGLGLTISRRLAEALGGSLTVSGKEGVGSTFTIMLPVSEAELTDVLTVGHIASRRDQDDEPKGTLIRLPSKHILVVDDGPANRRLIKLVLQRAGAHVTTAENGREAIKALAERDFELIFMDMQMPVLDGYSATQRIRGAGLEVPIVALTGNAMKGDREKCIDAGCTDFLTKPVDIDELLRCTASCIGFGGEDDSLPIEGEPLEDPEPISTRRDHAENSVKNPVSSVADPIYSELPMDDAELREISIDFIERLESRIDQITDALAIADFESVRSEAHWLKGAGGTIGFPDFTEPARGLEQAARQSDAELASQLLRVIDDIRSRVVIPGLDSSTDAPSGSTAVSEPAATDPLPDQPTSQSPIYCTLPFKDSEFCEIISDFVSRLDDRLVEMNQLCDAGEFEQLADAAHWLKGAGGTVGYAEFWEPAAALEAAAKRGSLDDSRRSLRALKEVRQRIVVPESPSNGGTS